MPDSRLALRLVLALLLVAAAAGARAFEIERSGGPYVPTPQAVVDAMLKMAKVGPKDFVIDLGSGDGRIVLTAAERHNARGLGVDIDLDLVEQSAAEAKLRGLASRVRFRQQDVMDARIGEASVVTLYLLPSMMQALQAKFMRELKPGTRIVSHDFAFPDWKPDQQAVVDAPGKYGSPGPQTSTLHYWVVPARIEGIWVLTAPGLSAQPVPLALAQQYQFFRSGASAKGDAAALSAGRIEAERISFRLALAGATHEFRGVVEGDRMRGEVVQGGRQVAWTAVRASTATVH